MNDRKFGMFLIIFSVAYFIFTSFIIGHGVHSINSIVMILLAAMGVYFYKIKGGGKLNGKRKRGK